jgi:hypothetical protein
MRSPRIARLLVALLAAASLFPVAADAGCGCDKRPPKQAVVRPRFASANWPVILFHQSLVPGRKYDVTFIRTTPSGRKLERTLHDQLAELKRDQADFPFEELRLAPEQRTRIKPKPQLRVFVPGIGGPGPRAIRVVDALTKQVKFEIPESEFLLIGNPIEVRPAATWARSYITAVDGDGYVYIALDLHKVLDATVLEGLVSGDSNRKLLPEHVVGYNAQGWMFSVLSDLPKNDATFKWEIVPSDGKNSDMLRYWRHSFREWDTEHDQHGWGPKRNAPDDGYYWHVDGTPHVDHNLWVVAIKEDFVRIKRMPRKGGSKRVIRLWLHTYPDDDLQ